MLHFARAVGISPGTSTIAIGSGLGRPVNRTQDPGVPWLMDAMGLGEANYPTDFDLAPSHGYLPVYTGWIEGEPSLYGARGLGQNPVEELEAEAISQEDVFRLQVRAAQEQIKTHKAQRVWSAVSGMVGVGMLAATVFAVSRGLRR